MWNRLPSHLVSNILSRLDVKSLLRYRSVSKRDCALIDSPLFIKSHIRTSLFSNSNRTIIFASVNGTSMFHLPFDLSNPSPTFINHPFKHRGAHFLGSCNGLFLLLAGTSPDKCIVDSVVVRHPPTIYLVLVNPAIRNYKCVPVSPIEYPARCSNTKCDSINYGFGYDFVNDDYNVVRITQFSDVQRNEVKIYSLKFNQWRRGEDCPYRLGTSTTQAVYLNGALHFRALVPTPFGTELLGFVAFDLASEEYRVIPQPLCTYIGDIMMILTVLGGKLCLNCNYDNMRQIDMWVMESYGVVESWTKILKIEQTVDLVFMQLEPLAYSNNGNKVLLLKDNGELIWYDLKWKVIERISNPAIPKFWRAYASMESLVKLGMPLVQRKMKKRTVTDVLW